MKYVPERGDVIWIDFDPQAGHEQRGHRPALVLSPLRYNAATGLAVLCPVTSRVKKYPFEVDFTGKRVQGVVLADQVKSIDWRARGAKLAEHANDLADEVARVLAALIAG